MDTDEGDAFYQIDSATGELIYDVEHHSFKTLKTAFGRVGVDIFTLKTEEALNKTWRELRHVVDHFVQFRCLNRKANNLDTRLLQAILRDDDKERERIMALLKKKNAIGINLI